MAVEFNAKEVFEIAEQIERNGARFYRKAAESLEDASAKKLLNELAEMEDEHEETFSKMKMEYEATTETEYVDPDNESVAYLSAIAEGKVFDIKSNPVDFLNKPQSLRDILNKAIELERDSIVFYLGIKEIVPESLGKDKIDNILREERKHVIILNEKLRSLD